MLRQAPVQTQRPSHPCPGPKSQADPWQVDKSQAIHKTRYPITPFPSSVFREHKFPVNDPRSSENEKVETTPNLTVHRADSPPVTYVSSPNGRADPWQVEKSQVISTTNAEASPQQETSQSPAVHAADSPPVTSVCSPNGRADPWQVEPQAIARTGHDEDNHRR